MILLGEKEFFKGIGEIKYEGRDSDNPLAFKYYNPDQVATTPFRFIPCFAGFNNCAIRFIHSK